MESNGTKTLSDLTKDLLRELYLEQHLTEKEIADLFSTTQVTVGRRRRKWGIPTLGNTGRITANLSPLSETQKSILVGSLLGDGHMKAVSSKTARFIERHSTAQEAYLRWKAEHLHNYVSSIYPVTKREKDGREYPGVEMATVTCETLRPYYDLFYKGPKGQREFPSSLDKMFDPLALAVWFLDDGSCSRFHPTLAFGLDPLSLKRAARALRRLGLEIAVSGQEGETQTISFPGQTDKFFQIVEPHIPSCMAYKLPQKSARRDQDQNARKLSSDKARELYDGGMSITEIAAAYGVGRSTAHRRVHSEGSPKRMGRPRKTYTLTASEVALERYASSQWSNLSDEDKERWVDEVQAILRKTPFPATPSWSSDRAEAELEKLVSLEAVEEDGVIRPQSHRGTVLCQSFFPHRYKSSWRGTRCAYEAWHDDNDLRKAIRFQFKQGDPVAPHRVLRAVTMNCRTPGVFRPVVAKFMYETYCPKGGRTWDPCSGWGGRLMGAAAAGVHYVATDVEPETVEGNRRLADALGFKEHTLVLQEAQTFETSNIDMVFTSPPYFDVEHYGSSASQSFRVFTKFEDWVAGFFKPVLERSFSVLKPGGVAAFNVANIHRRKEVFPLPDRTVEEAKGAGFVHETTLWMPLSGLNRSKERRRELILIFRKP
jgi:transposase-like protein